MCGKCNCEEKTEQVKKATEECCSDANCKCHDATEKKEEAKNTCGCC